MGGIKNRGGEVAKAHLMEGSAVEEILDLTEEKGANIFLAPDSLPVLYLPKAMAAQHHAPSLPFSP